MRRLQGRRWFLAKLRRETLKSISAAHLRLLEDLVTSSSGYFLLSIRPMSGANSPRTFVRLPNAA
jgi:hypothetical protein